MNFSHFDPLIRYGQGFDFFKGVSPTQATIGHFFAVFGVPFYVAGAWHLYVMLRPASAWAARAVFLLMSYGCIVGAVWIGSRATAAALVHSTPPSLFPAQIALYELRYETLLTVVRLAVLLVSLLFVWLVLTGRSHYPRWMAFFNPILLIVGSFLVYLALPSFGRFLMPIALNVAYLFLFSLSTYLAARLPEETSP